MYFRQAISQMPTFRITHSQSATTCSERVKYVQKQWRQCVQG